MFKINFGKNKNLEPDNDNKDPARGIFMRPGTIDEEPDSVDSIISNPASFPITVVPSSLVRSATQQSFGKYSRQSSIRYLLYFMNHFFFNITFNSYCSAYLYSILLECYIISSKHFFCAYFRQVILMST